MMYCDVIALLSNCIPFEMSLKFMYCKFSSSILKYISKVVKTVIKVALRNPFSVYCNNFLEITVQHLQVNLNVLYCYGLATSCLSASQMCPYYYIFYIFT